MTWRSALGVVLAGLAVGQAQATEVQETVVPPRADPSQHFTIDPVVDGLLIVGGVAFSELEGPSIWLGYQPMPNGPGALTLGGRF